MVMMMMMMMRASAPPLPPQLLTAHKTRTHPFKKKKKIEKSLGFVTRIHVCFRGLKHTTEHIWKKIRLYLQLVWGRKDIEVN